MAKPGNFAAYRRSRKTEEDFGDNMLQAENQQFKYRQEERVEDQIEYKKQQDREASMNADFEKMKPVITGVSTLDEINTRAINQGMQSLGDIHRELGGNISSKRREELIYKKNMLTKAPEFMAAAAKNITEWTASTTEKIQDGTASDWDLMELERAKAHFGVKGEDGKMSPNFVVDFDEKGHPISKYITEGGEFGKLSYIDVVNGVSFNGNTSKHDMRTYSSDLVKSLGEKQATAIKNGRFETYQTFDSQKESVSKMLDSALGTAEDPSDIAKSLWADSENMGKDPRDFNADSIKAIKENLMTSIKAGYDETVRSVALPQNNSDDMSVSEKAKAVQGDNLYRDVNLAAQGDATALANLGGRSKRVGTNADGTAKYLTAKDAFIADGHIKIVDGNGEVLEQVNMELPQEVRAKQLLAWFSDGSPNESSTSYSIGQMRANSQVPQAGGLAPQRKSSEVPAVSTDVLNTIQMSDDESTMLNSLRYNFKEETGFKFQGTGVINDVIKIMAPNGNQQEFKLKGNLETVRESMKQFMDKNQTESKTIYQPVEGAEQNQVEPTEDNPLGLDL